MRQPPAELEARFQDAKNTPSDINEHLELIREYASRVEHVTEFGMRGANGSTVALLAAQPATFVSWDINPHAVVSQTVLDLLSERGRTDFQPRVGNTLNINIEETDLLFIDTLHTYKQLKAELDRHATKVRKYIIFHDTKTFGAKGEDGNEPGLRAAIRWLQVAKMFPLWQLVEDRDNNNGLVVLEML